MGKLSDQAELCGVLNTLYEMHLPILEVANLIEVDDARDELTSRGIESWHL